MVLALSAYAGEAPPVQSQPPPFHSKDSPEIRRIAEEAVAAYRKHENARKDLLRAAPREFTEHREASEVLNRSTPAFLQSMRDYETRKQEERQRIENEFTAGEAAAFGESVTSTQAALAQAAPEEYEAYERAYERTQEAVANGMADLQPMIPAYEALMALQRTAPREFRDYRDSSEQRKAQVHSIIGGYRMYRAFTAYKRTRQALVSVAPDQFEAWVSAGKALEKYQGLTIYNVPEEER